MNQHSKTINWKIWWRLLRPHTLTAAFVPVSIGTALAIPETNISMTIFITMLTASILIQAATNMFNEYYDYVRGLDNKNSVGIGGAIVRDGIQAKTVLYLALSFFFIATVLGLYICYMSSWWVAIIGLISMLTGYLYTGGPYPIAYTPLGELVAGFFMGLIIIILSFFIQTGSINLESILISVPISILIGAILMANNIRDLDGDKKNGRSTLAILLGKNNAIKFLAGMFVVSYIWIIGLMIFASFTPWILLALLSIPKAVKAVKGFIGKNLPLEMLPAMKYTAQTNTQFGFMIALGILIGNFF